jgi:hypothetical protein
MTKTIPHPYRENATEAYCVTCGQKALVRCPRCGRPFCTDHAAMTSCCADCELALSRSTRRWLAGTMAGYVAAMGSAACYLGMLEPILGFVTGSFGVLGGIFVGAVAARLARGREKGWEPVENAELRIGPESAESRPARRLGWLVRTAGRKDMYQAAYDAGMNRQGGV